MHMCMNRMESNCAYPNLRGGGGVTEHSSWFQLHVHGELTSQKILNMAIGFDWLNQNTDFLIRSYFQSAAYKLIIIELQFKYWLS